MEADAKVPHPSGRLPPAEVYQKEHLDVKRPTRYFQAAWVHAKLERQGMKAPRWTQATLA